MMLATHALIGAAIGRIIGNRALSLFLGVTSHAAADMIPHREVPPSVDLPVTVATVGILACRYGVDSPEVMGAVGGMAPDLEHMPTFFGWRTDKSERFPTHGPTPQRWLHSSGIEPAWDWPQWITVTAVLSFLAKKGTRLKSAEEAPSEPSHRDPCHPEVTTLTSRDSLPCHPERREGSAPYAMHAYVLGGASPLRSRESNR